MSRLFFAVFRREWLSLASYRLAAFTRLVGLVGVVLSAHFLAVAFAGYEPSALGGGYFGFLLLGVAAADLSDACLSGPSGKIRQAQLEGTLEATVSGVSALKLCTAEALVCAAFGLLRVAAYGLLALPFGFNLNVVDPLAASLAVALTLASLLPLGLMGAALTLLLKRANPLGYAVSSASLLASGVAYPTEVLPDWVAMAGQALPPTHALMALRGAFLHGQSTASLLGPLLWLLGFAVVGGPLAVGLFKAAERLARRLGSLGQY